MESSSHFDVIVVGLGCVGLASTYYLAKNGLKVLGLEQYPDSGYLGSSSVGHSRIWRLTHPRETKYRDMQLEALEIWREVEGLTGKKLLEQEGFLMVMEEDSLDLKFIFDNYEGEKLTNEQIKKRFPALSRLQDNWAGFYDWNAGVVRARKALDAFKEVSLKHGADLRYGAKVSKIDAKEGSVVVTLEGQEKKFTADKVVMSTGTETQKFFSEASKLKVDTHPMETFMFGDSIGLPPAIIMMVHVDGEYQEVFGLKDGADLQYYKFGNELGSARNKDMVDFLHRFFPEKLPSFMSVSPCFYQMTEGHHFLFECEDKAIFACGLNGKGFKHMPYHGKRVFHLVKGNQQEADKYK